MNKYISSPRIIGDYNTGEPGPLFLAIGGLHGNEPSGVMAIRRILKWLIENKIMIKGEFVGIAGNLRALEKNQRYIDEDLNRMFLEDRIEEVRERTARNTEEKELIEVLDAIKYVTRNADEVYFIDCHTTSSETVPYISVNQFEKSLWLADQFPLCSVAGLENGIFGCFAAYFNKRGFHGFTFEAGQHEDDSSVRTCEAALWLCMVFAGLIARDAHSVQYSHCYEVLSKNTVEGKREFQMVANYKIQGEEKFRMQPGFVNFQKIERGQLLAFSNERKIYSDYDGRILLPLYQKKGQDGFFILKEREASF